MHVGNKDKMSLGNKDGAADQSLLRVRNWARRDVDDRSGWRFHDRRGGRQISWREWDRHFADCFCTIAGRLDHSVAAHTEARETPR